MMFSGRSWKDDVGAHLVNSGRRDKAQIHNDLRDCIFVDEGSFVPVKNRNETTNSDEH